MSACVFLGCMTVEEMEKRLGLELTDEERKTLSDMIQTTASNIAPGKIHIFDIPFGIMCGDAATQQKIVEIFTRYKGKSNVFFQCWIDNH